MNKCNPGPQLCYGKETITCGILVSDGKDAWTRIVNPNIFTCLLILHFSHNPQNTCKLSVKSKIK
jgi:hypothetical protein